MASLLRGQGVVSAIDINKGCLRILEKTAKSHNVNDVINVVHADLRIFSEKISKKFDKVLLDAPRSGLGVLSKEFIINPADRYVPADFVTDKGFFFSNPVKHRFDGSFGPALSNL